MEPQPAEGYEWEWRQPEALRRFHELMSNADAVATLRFEKMFSCLAIGQFGPRSWTFQREGFTPRITVRELDTGVEATTFTPGMMGEGSVVFASGNRYQMQHLNFWRTGWAFVAADGNRIVELTGHTGVLRQTAKVRVAFDTASNPEAQILTLLMWYARLLARQDSAAAATSVVP